MRHSSSLFVALLQLFGQECAFGEHSLKCHVCIQEQKSVCYNFTHFKPRFRLNGFSLHHFLPNFIQILYNFILFFTDRNCTFTPVYLSRSECVLSNFQLHDYFFSLFHHTLRSFAQFTIPAIDPNLVRERERWSQAKEIVDMLLENERMTRREEAGFREL